MVNRRIDAGTLRFSKIRRNMDSFKDKTLMITGGTGSFGNTVLKHFMNTDLAEIRGDA